MLHRSAVQIEVNLLVKEHHNISVFRHTPVCNAFLYKLPLVLDYNKVTGWWSRGYTEVVVVIVVAVVVIVVVLVVVVATWTSPVNKTWCRWTTSVDRHATTTVHPIATTIRERSPTDHLLTTRTAHTRSSRVVVVTVASVVQGWTIQHAHTHSMTLFIPNTHLDAVSFQHWRRVRNDQEFDTHCYQYTSCYCSPVFTNGYGTDDGIDISSPCACR